MVTRQPQQPQFPTNDIDCLSMSMVEVLSFIQRSERAQGCAEPVFRIYHPQYLVDTNAPAGGTFVPGMSVAAATQQTSPAMRSGLSYATCCRVQEVEATQ
jgi:hypothetical protein